MMRIKSRLYTTLETALFLGMEVNYRGLSICDLGTHCITRQNLPRRYQVDCNSGGIHFSAIYYDYDRACDKFCALFGVLKDNEGKNANSR